MTSNAETEAVQVPTQLERNKDLVRCWLAAAEQGNLEEALAYCAADHVNHGSVRPGQRLPAGRDGAAIVGRLLRTAFPDRQRQIEAMIAEGDLVACYQTVSGTFGTSPEPPFPVPSGWVGVEGSALVGPEAAGRHYSVKQMHLFRISNGLIAEHWAARDDLGLLLQLGAIAIPTREARQK